MKKSLALVLLAVTASGISACAVKNDRTEFGFFGFAYHSNITRTADGNYQAAVEAAPLRGRVGGAKALATQDAVDKCALENKAMRVIKDETSSHLLINGVARLTFVCE